MSDEKRYGEGMPGVPQRRWKIRRLLELVNNPHGHWTRMDTDILIDLVLTSKYNDEKQLSRKIAQENRKRTMDRRREHRAELDALKAEFSQELARVEHEAALSRKEQFNEIIERELPKLAKLLTSGAGLAWEKAVDPETGELDPSRLDRKELETSLKFIQAITKAAGVDGVQKVEHTVHQGSVFDALDEVEVQDAELVPETED